ncbi:xanthine dehydrogenase accessory protein XdhC [Roseibium sp.]|uniref:xanthine dehydrogenase accessory protein XdhC n=1 Tax=Roseibium sp. TaxID=1936156 RepID=UPI003B50D392
MKVWAHISDSLKTCGSCALVTVVDVDGSAPREEGARMVVRPDASFFGTIGGGTLELEIIRKAARLSADKVALLDMQTVALGPDLGQCCGGRAKLSIEVLTANYGETAELLARQENSGQVFTTSAELRDGCVGPRRLLEEPVTHPFSLFESTDKTDARIIERFGEARTPLALFGAGHVGKALVLALAPLPFSITWIDSRSDQFPGAVPANVTKVALDNPASALDDLPSGTFVLAVTHSHALDEEIMARALLLQRFGYCGVIGSKTKRARFIKRLKERGLNDLLIAQMICPIGKTTIKSKHPSAIAAGIAVDLLERIEAGQIRETTSSGLAQNMTHGQ